MVLIKAWGKIILVWDCRLVALIGEERIGFEVRRLIVLKRLLFRLVCILIHSYIDIADGSITAHDLLKQMRFLRNLGVKHTSAHLFRLEELAPLRNWSLLMASTALQVRTHGSVSIHIDWLKNFTFIKVPSILWYSLPEFNVLSSWLRSWNRLF